MADPAVVARHAHRLDRAERLAVEVDGGGRAAHAQVDRQRRSDGGDRGVADGADGGAARPSASASRARSSTAKSCRGAIGTTGWRSASSGSAGIVVLLSVGAAERDAGPDEQGLGGVDGAPQLLGHLGDGQAVEVAQRERGLVVGAELGQHVRGRGPASTWASHGSSHGTTVSSTALSWRSSRARRRQWSTSLWRATPTSQATVRSGTASRCTAETAARKVSAVRSSATAGVPVRGQQVAVDLREGPVVEREQAGALVGDGRLTTHASIIVGRRPAPTGRVRSRHALDQAAP